MSRKDYLLGYSPRSARGAWQLVDELVAEGEDPRTAMLRAAIEIDGAGENLTVESMATCRALDDRPIPGVTGDDSVTKRRDRFAASAEKRRLAAELDQDEAAHWLSNRNR